VLKKSDIEKGNNLMLTRLNPSGKNVWAVRGASDR